MVKRIMLSLALAIGVCMAAAPPDDPKAKDLMPSASELPTGQYRVPWQMGPNSVHKSEAEWHAKNLPTHTGIPKIIEMFRQMPEADWQQMVSNMTQMAQSGLIPPGGSANDPQSLMLDSIIKDGSREGLIKTLQAAVEGMLDSAVMEYIRVEKPDALATELKPGETPDLGSVIRLKVSIEIWDAAAMSNRVDGVDLTGEEVQAMVGSSRVVFERIARMVVGKTCASLEEDLGQAQAYTPIDPAKVDKILQEMSDAAATRIEVSAKSLGLGDNAHIIKMYRGMLPSQPEVAQGSARFRRGRAIVSLGFDVIGSFATTFETELIDAMPLFETKLSAFDLTIATDGQ